GEGLKDVISGIEENLLPPAVRKPSEAKPDLGQRDRGREQLAPVAAPDPGGHLRRWLRTHQLGDHVRIEDDHLVKSAARAGSARAGRSTSTPPRLPNRSRSAVKRPAESAGSWTA